MILLIDSYDSFSHNLCRLIEVNSGKEVVTIYNDTFSPDEYEDAFHNWIKYFDYIIVGPGPGHPAEEKDIGIVKWLYQHFGSHPGECVPVLGVCLGFQSLCNEFGNEVLRLESIKHGQIYDIVPQPSDLFGDANLEPFPSVRYHSLHVKISTLNDKIVPLATCTEATVQEGQDAEILMAGRHASLPLYGVQYHPESICSEQGDKLLQRFDNIAHRYNQKERPTLKDEQEKKCMKETSAKYVNARAVHEEWLIKSGSFKSNGGKLHAAALSLDESVSAIDVCDYFNKKDVDFVFLNSAADPGEWCIIGLPISQESEIISHSMDEPEVVAMLKFKGEDSTKVRGNVWEIIALEMENRFVDRSEFENSIKGLHSRPFPFFGGYMGLFSYEEGRHIRTDEMTSFCKGNTPDAKLIYIERFILYDRVTKSWFVASIYPHEEENKWVDLLCEELVAASKTGLSIDISKVPLSVKLLYNKSDREIAYEFPDRETYKEQFALCQEYLHSGDSYELCLTTQLKLFLPKYLNTWDIYKVLALHKNPSPYSSYMSFDDCVLISSSPERFLSWKDDGKTGGKLAELRPIKGTVRNTPSVSLEDATKILRTPKEMGENLMIVDLIRHDLHSFLQEVNVAALMAVEEYKTVYQLVSVIQGKLPEVGFKGIDVLHLSLPPGSMTGAPKKRSVEILQKIESMQSTMAIGGRRGIYSGVAGYWSVTDDADWSVVIRSLMHYRDDKENTDSKDVWRIGAGGAITVLSDEDGEWEEMQVKLLSTLQTFT